MVPESPSPPGCASLTKETAGISEVNQVQVATACQRSGAATRLSPGTHGSHPVWGPQGQREQGSGATNV
jgi:hypothetical protein